MRVKEDAVLEEVKKVGGFVEELAKIYLENYKKRGKYKEINEKIKEMNKELKYFKLEARRVGVSYNTSIWAEWRNSRKGLLQYSMKNHSGYVFSIIIKARIKGVERFKDVVKQELWINKNLEIIEGSYFKKSEILWWVEKTGLNVEIIKKYLRSELSLIKGTVVLRALEECYGKDIKYKFIKDMNKDFFVSFSLSFTFV